MTDLDKRNYDVLQRVCRVFLFKKKYFMTCTVALSNKGFFSVGKTSLKASNCFFLQDPSRLSISVPVYIRDLSVSAERISFAIPRYRLHAASAHSPL